MDMLTCTQCRTANPATASFCSSCGAALASGAAPETPPSTPSGWALATAGIDQPPAPLDPTRGPVRKEECASWWARLGAYLLDGIFLMVILGIAGLALWMVGSILDPDSMAELSEWFLDGAYYDPSDPALAWLGVGFLVLVGVAVWWDVYWIRTPRFMARPGQWIAGFRVVRTQGVERVTTGRAFGRAFAKFGISAMLGWIYTVVCAFTIGLGGKRQALHDLVAGTVCVRRDALAARGVGPDADGVPRGAGYQLPAPGSAAATTTAPPGGATPSPGGAPQSPPTTPATDAPQPPPSASPGRPDSGHSGPFV